MSLCNVVSEENRKLMQEILERSAQNQDEMTGRVTALLAGSALTTKAGVRIQRRDTVEQVDYTAVGEFILGTTLLHFRFSCFFYFRCWSNVNHTNS